MKWNESIALNMRMLKYLFQASPGYCIVNAVNTVCNSLLFVMQIVLYRYVIDGVVYSRASVKQIAVYFFIYYGIRTVSYAIDHGIQNNFNEKEKIKIAQYYKNLVCGESVKKSISNLSHAEYADRLCNAAYSDGEHLYHFAGAVFGFVNDMVVFLFFFGLLLELHPVFVLAAVLMAVKNMICAEKTNRAQFEKHQISLPFERRDRYLHNLFYLKQYAPEMRMYPMSGHFVHQYERSRELHWKSKKKSEDRIRRIDTYSGITDLFFYLCSMLLLVYFLITWQITVGEFSIVLTNLTVAAGNIERVLMLLPNIKNEAHYIKDIFFVLDAEEHVYPKVRDTEGEGKVLFRNVSFSYDGETSVLQNIDIELPLWGKTVIVGRNGSGKSTFIKLLLGLYKPSEGEIEFLYPGIQDGDTLCLFSTLLQDYKVFALTVGDNVLRRETGEEEDTAKITEALRFGGLLEKVEGFPNGIRTVLSGEFSQEGVGLSGGEQQKLAISRAYADSNPVLVLDEPSGNLDPIAENELIHRINELTEHKAAILVTHDLAYTRSADLVVVFEEGRILEHGSPKELLQKKGCYYQK